MSPERRNLLKFLCLSSLTATLTPMTGCSKKEFYDPEQDIIVGGGRYQQEGELKHVLAVVNLQQKEKRLVELDFLAHGIIVDPNDNKRLIVFEKIGPGAAEIDLNKHIVSSGITTTKDKHFYGHGAFDKTGATLFCTETYLDDHKGIIAIRDARSFELLGEFPTYGENPHECQLIDDGSTLVVTNAGSDSIKDSQPSVTYIDVQSQQLLDQVRLTNQQLNTGHIGIADDGSLIVASAPREGLDKTQPGGVSIRSGKQSMLSMTEPVNIVDQMTGEALSVAIDNRHGIAAVTHPDGNMVTFWSIEKRTLLKSISLDGPRGVTLSLDGKAFIISYDVSTNMVLVSTDDLSVSTDPIMQPTYISGSHIYNWSKAMTETMPADKHS
ncbi:MAG: DUF1513 domain-containing protein [Proteobacteria bacterium]|nr:DUF1513 domain-containing protein [Pseudomonadota bacterium]